MKPKSTLLLLLLLFNYSYAAEIFNLEIKKIPEPNLLKNANFIKIKNKVVPESWIFIDYSKKPGFSFNFDRGIFNLKTSGELYGYLIQPRVSVQEGKSYYAEVKVKLNSRALLWIMTSQYDDKLSPLGEPKSSTKIYSIANPEHGTNLVNELKYFIKSDYLIPFSSTEWNYCKLEFTVPKGHKITQYDFKIGAYGGKDGWIKFKEPFFSLARQKFQLTLRGKNLTKLKILHPNGKIEHLFSLDPNKNKNHFNITLNSRITRYFAEIIDSAGKSYRRAL